MYIFALGPPAGVDAYLKMGRGPTAQQKLAREALAIRLLAQPPYATVLGGLVPRLRAHGVARGWSYLLLTALHGMPGDRLLAKDEVRDQLIRDAARLTAELHGSASISRPASPEDIHAWIQQPLAIVDSLLPHRLRLAGRRTLSRLEDELRAYLSGRTIAVGPVHGDFWPRNILADANGRVMGVLDWDSFDPQNLLIQDLLHLLIYTRKVLHGSELGAEVIAALDAPEWSATEAAVLAAASDGHRQEPIQLLRPRLLLYWLRQVSVNVERQPGHTRRAVWIRANVTEVLACL